MNYVPKSFVMLDDKGDGLALHGGCVLGCGDDGWFFYYVLDVCRVH